jgi:hypothetical protein
MSKLFVNKEVLRSAKKVVAEKKEKLEPTEDQPLPVVELWYPLHGRGRPTQRFVRVLEMNDTHIKGFEITSEFDEEPGKPHTYRIDKVEADGCIQLLHLAKSTE